MKQYGLTDRVLSNYGFLIYEILEPKDIQTRIIGKRGMKAFEHINYVQAVIKKNGWWLLLDSLGKFQFLIYGR